MSTFMLCGFCSIKDIKIFFSIFFIQLSLAIQGVKRCLRAPKAANLLKLKNLKKKQELYAHLNMFLLIASHIVITMLKSVIAHHTFCSYRAGLVVI